MVLSVALGGTEIQSVSSKLVVLSPGSLARTTWELLENSALRCTKTNFNQEYRVGPMHHCLLEAPWIMLICNQG